MSQRSALKVKPVYGIITPEILGELFTTRLLAADLLSRSHDRCTAHAASMVRHTLEALHSELTEIIE